MSRPATATPITSSVGTSSIAATLLQFESFIGAPSDRIDDGVRDHFAVVHAQARRELQPGLCADHGVDVAADVEHGRHLVELGAKDRVVRLALEAVAFGLANH